MYYEFYKTYLMCWFIVKYVDVYNTVSSILYIKYLNIFNISNERNQQFFCCTKLALNV